MKKADLVFGPITIAGFRVAGGALVLCLIALITRQWCWPERRQWPILIFIITIGYAMPYVIQPVLVPICGSGFVGMIVGFVPLMTVLVSIPLLRVWPSKQQAIGVIGGLICLFLIIGDGLQRSFSPWYLLLGVLVPTFYACANSLVRKNLQETPPLLSSAWCLLGSSIPLLPIGLLTEPLKSEGSLAMAITCVVILGCVGTGLIMYAFYSLINRRGPLYAGMVAYIIPIGAVLIGSLDGEAISLYQWLAMFGIIVMVILVQCSKGKQTEH